MHWYVVQILHNDAVAGCGKCWCMCKTGIAKCQKLTHLCGFCSQPAVAIKRKILKPVQSNYLNKGKHQDVLPANMLFGDAFMVPKLRR